MNSEDLAKRIDCLKIVSYLANAVMQDWFVYFPDGSIRHSVIAGETFGYETIARIDFGLESISCQVDTEESYRIQLWGLVCLEEQKGLEWIGTSQEFCFDYFFTEEELDHFEKYTKEWLDREVEKIINLLSIAVKEELISYIEGD